MFLHLCVILFAGGVSVPSCITCHMTRRVCLQGEVYIHGGVFIEGGSAFRGDLHPGGSASRVGSAYWGCWADPPRYMGYYGIGSTSGQYASYLNAFLITLSSWVDFDVTLSLIDSKVMTRILSFALIFSFFLLSSRLPRASASTLQWHK